MKLATNMADSDVDEQNWSFMDSVLGSTEVMQKVVPGKGVSPEVEEGLFQWPQHSTQQKTVTVSAKDF